MKTGAVEENQQRKFFDEHGLDAGLAGPDRKIRQGDTLTKTGAVGKIGSLHANVNSAARDGLCRSWGRLGPI